MKATLGKTQPRFSSRSFLVAFLFHAVSSALLGGLAFTTAMGAFTRNVSSEMTFFQILAWMWTPPQMFAIRYHSGNFGLGGLFLVTVIWSSFVGLTFGFIIPCFFSSRRDIESADVKQTT